MGELCRCAVTHAQKRRRSRRAALRYVHHEDVDMVEAVDDTLGYEQDMEEAQEALQGEAEIVWSSEDDGHESDDQPPCADDEQSERRLSDVLRKRPFQSFRSFLKKMFDKDSANLPVSRPHNYEQR